MKSIQDGVLVVAFSFLLLTLSGCGSSDQPELGRVTGTVTMNGAPLSGVVVVFHPDNGRPARGKTDATGKYQLTYVGETLGSKVGPNRVEIAASEEGDEESSASPDTESTSAPKRPKRANVEIPARYNINSELKADVKPGENVFDFKLDSK